MPLIVFALLLGATFFVTSQAQAAYKLTSPKEYVGVGPFQIKDCKKCQVDKRILLDVENLATAHNMVVSLGRTGRPELTHGAGTSVDFVPAPGYSKKVLASALRDLKGREAIQAAFIINGHLHVSWKSSSRPNGNLVSPAAWVMVIWKSPALHASLSDVSFRSTRTLFSPRVYRKLPSAISAPRADVWVDARIIGNLRYLAGRFNVAVSSGRNDASLTHGAGTSADIVPGRGGSWKQVAAAARFLKNQAAIDSVIDHGAGDHLHVSWKDSYGSAADGNLRPPARWVKVFG